MTGASTPADETAAWASWFVWGLAVACIFLTYNLVGATDGAGLPEGLVAWLWAPWVALAIVASSVIARLLGARGFDVRDRATWLGSLAATGVIVGAELLVPRLPLPESPNASNLVLVGAIAAGLAILQRIQGRGAIRPGLTGGGVVAGVGLLVPHLAAVETTRGLIAAGAASLVFVAIGGMGLAGSRAGT